MIREFISIAYGIDDCPTGGHVICEPEDAKIYVRDCPGEEDRDGKCATVNVVRVTNDEQDGVEG